MKHQLTAFLGLGLTSFSLFAQQGPQEKQVLDLLDGGTRQQWSVIGTRSATGGSCTPGEAYYTFQRSPAQVVVQECAGGTWKPRTVACTTWSNGGKAGVTFDGRSYEVKMLHAGAPVCKGSANCLRLTSLPDGKSDVATNIYLTR
ncbi:MAG: hypothetical protein JNL05_07815 [Flavobacteriales bacterium]|nr:hypothetical protein [Flavobacteriales bacterium]